MCDCLAKGDVPQLEVNFRRQEQYGDEFAMGLLKEEPLAGDQAAFPGAKEDEAYAFAGGAWPRRDCPEVGPRAPPELREAAPSLEAEGSREAPRPPEGRERCGREGCSSTCSAGWRRRQRGRPTRRPSRWRRARSRPARRATRETANLKTCLTLMSAGQREGFPLDTVPRDGVAHPD
ncbi:unnamed protein product [Prorocentrum cordatum]|uniref:Uncharacterized protein n=1 Tax=Prorocentrum cordatum TaxID=2364126 RepID=A0ABN9QK27_9DINO|nr:unnamed protein product [Polarella glacialis]